MRSQFRHVALFGKYHTTTQGGALESSRRALDDVAQFLTRQGCDVVLDKETALHTGLNQYPMLEMTDIGTQCDLGLVIGGDGTMLGIGRQMARFNLPLMGINQGRLGFITDIPLQSYQDVLRPMLQGHYQTEDRSLLQAHVMRDQRSVFSALAMNDVVVNRGGTSGMVELRVEVDGRFVSNQRADGLIIATPTGSTAYSLSVGGPLMHPAIGGWVMAPIAPHTLSNRPIVLPESSEISIEIVAGRYVSANFDMQSLADLILGDRIMVKRSEHTVRFLHPEGWNYFDTLRKKMHWNEGA
ncbi:MULTISPECIES: NAD kinase [unclassified Limnohabitans]|jgi:NAD+ kinase|uniref:NAD kinase n=1 Tax=unclassified Limnohabitans TaxID=2626134 RepID=UPI000D37C29C|nr:MULTISPECIES: NAD kinase [unclassified Limnohabitans]PUE19616.1 NAD kinase [Limnohabitans sp. MMS-10A-192]PUE26977.1 NAD kinase [Limnohabitans sp. MMS-10A-160]